MNVGSARQPFYYCLPDETDSVRLFGGGAWAWFCGRGGWGTGLAVYSRPAVPARHPPAPCSPPCPSAPPAQTQCLLTVASLSLSTWEHGNMKCWLPPTVAACCCLPPCLPLPGCSAHHKVCCPGEHGTRGEPRGAQGPRQLLLQLQRRPEALHTHSEAAGVWAALACGQRLCGRLLLAVGAVLHKQQQWAGGEKQALYLRCVCGSPPMLTNHTTLPLLPARSMSTQTDTTPMTWRQLATTPTCWPTRRWSHCSGPPFPRGAPTAAASPAQSPELEWPVVVSVFPPPAAAGRPCPPNSYPFRLPAGPSSLPAAVFRIRFWFLAPACQPRCVLTTSQRGTSVSYAPPAGPFHSLPGPSLDGHLASLCLYLTLPSHETPMQCLFTAHSGHFTTQQQSARGRRRQGAAASRGTGAAVAGRMC